MSAAGRLQTMERLGIIMKFLDAEFVQGFIRMADDGWQQGWHERNGGNLSYRVKPEEVELVKENFEPKEFQPIGTTVPALAGEYFLVTGSGKYFRNVSIKPEDSICMIELDDKGENYRQTYLRAPQPPDESGSEEAAGSRLPCCISCTYHQYHCADLRASSGG